MVMVRVAGIGLFAVLGIAVTSAQDDKPRAKSFWSKKSRELAEAFTIKPSDTDGEPYKLHPSPIFEHRQPVRGNDIGLIHLWVTSDGRPAVVGDIFSFQTEAGRQYLFEGHSMLPESIQVIYRNVPFHASSVSGLEWKFFPTDTPKPNSDPELQALQARQLARKFAAHTIDKKKQRWELRLIPKPLYQYSSNDEGITHGSLFAFCEGTDTEALMLIEVIKSGEPEKAKSLRWRYSLAALTDFFPTVEYDGDEVWNAIPPFAPGGAHWGKGGFGTFDPAQDKSE